MRSHFYMWWRSSQTEGLTFCHHLLFFLPSPNFFCCYNVVVHNCLQGRWKSSGRQGPAWTCVLKCSFCGISVTFDCYGVLGERWLTKKVGKKATGRKSRSFPHFLGGHCQASTGFLTLKVFSVVFWKSILMPQDFGYFTYSADLFFNGKYIQ
jgi:hypothetical protein